MGSYWDYCSEALALLALSTLWTAVLCEPVFRKDFLPLVVLQTFHQQMCPLQAAQMGL
jgi:hypothetical protein